MVVVVPGTIHVVHIHGITVTTTAAVVHIRIITIATTAAAASTTASTVHDHPFLFLLRIPHVNPVHHMIVVIVAIATAVALFLVPPYVLKVKWMQLSRFSFFFAKETRIGVFSH